VLIIYLVFKLILDEFLALPIAASLAEIRSMSILEPWSKDAMLLPSYKLPLMRKNIPIEGRRIACQFVLTVLCYNASGIVPQV